MTTLQLLALAGYFLILIEYIAMRHRDICAESDARIEETFKYSTGLRPVLLYWNRGTK